MRLVGLAAVLGPVAVGAACATAPPATSGTPGVESERTVLELRAKNAGFARRVEELENRIFILEDQLDSRRLAAEQRGPATLPALSPSLGADRVEPALTASSSSADDRGDSIQTTIVAEHAVDYAGDAAQPAVASPRGSAETATRPQLKLSATTPGAGSGASRGQGVPEPPPGARPGRAPSAEPLQLYRQALQTLRGGRPEVALVLFRRFLEANPQHDYADNAQYWIGECLYDQRQFQAAERAFRRVVERYPRGNKVPDAMLKLGFALQRLGDEVGGRAVLESLVGAFPKQEAARLASARLARPEVTPPRSAVSAPPLGTALPPVMP